MFTKLFSKYLLIGLSAIVLLAGAQNGLLAPQRLSSVYADDECSPQNPCPPPQEPNTPEPVCNEGAECRGDESFWVRRCDGQVVSEINYGRNPNGECGYTLPAPEQPAPEQPVPPAPPVCNLPPQERYPECGSDCTNGGRQAPTTWAMVTRNVDYNSCSITSYICDSIEYNSSQCGYLTPPQQPSQPEQPSEPQQPAQRAGACYLCDGTTRRLVSGNGGNFTSEADCRNSGEGNRSFDSNPAICQTSAPVVQAQTCYVCDNTGYADGQGRWRVDGNGCPSNPPVCVANNSNTFAGCLGAVVGQICEARATVAPTNPVCQSNGSCSVSTPLVCGTTVVGVDNCGRSCSRSSAACVVTPPAQGGNTTVNPVITVSPVITSTNTNSNSNTNTITNNVTREVVREVRVPATFGNVGVGNTVVYTQPVQYTALPKTGLPELAWSALAFIPTGFGLRRFAKVKKALENHPSYIWEDRQFKA